MSADDGYITEGPIRWSKQELTRALWFTPAQRAELEQLGVPAIAIKLLEVQGLPSIRKYLQPPPRRAEVRNELLKAQAAILAAHEAIERLLTPSDLPHLKGASQALKGLGVRHLEHGIPLNRASEALIPASKVIASVIAHQSKEPSRYKAASPRPILEIDKLLLQGCEWAGLPAVPVKGDLPSQITFLPHLMPSASPTSAFRRLVGICYERAGLKNTDPERAIKAYIRLRRI
jgi:hypothetical protein